MTSDEKRDADHLSKDEEEYYKVAETWPARDPAGDGQTTPDEYRPAGYQDQNPNMELIQDPLEWLELKTLSISERDSHIIARSNFYDQFYCQLADYGSLFDRLLKRAMKAGNFDMERPQKPLRMPSERLRECLPLPEIERKLRDIALDNRINEATIVSRFHQTHKMFAETRVARAITGLVHDHMKGIRCSEIVALGAGSLGHAACIYFGDPPFASYLPPEYGLWCQTQHAALLFIRDLLRFRQKEDIPIYISDPEYSDEDAKAAKRFGMTVVNGTAGFQQSWTKLTESTLVVDLHCIGPIVQRVFEITRPAAITTLLKVHPYKNARADRSKPYKIMLEGLEGGTIEVPGMGMEPKNQKEMVEAEYNTIPLFPDTSKPGVPGHDGRGGKNTPYGWARWLHLYTRK
ncbi:hypothetical protein ONS95_001440 [Cadophora gregata]|uniref:uncharacterized protein n=1 Tax=Cadophora gregata TaxID=51156 RepID=UPI0026DD2AF1|nr:uncharacterized protein ONS95_001440 [Cadophora gregata]KAK0111060.1 hypothetical protein ONS95_001440 [Cadophora gregata]